MAIYQAGSDFFVFEPRLLAGRLCGGIGGGEAIRGRYGAARVRAREHDFFNSASDDGDDSAILPGARQVGR